MENIIKDFFRRFDADIISTLTANRILNDQSYRVYARLRTHLLDNPEDVFEIIDYGVGKYLNGEPGVIENTDLGGSIEYFENLFFNHHHDRTTTKSADTENKKAILNLIVKYSRAIVHAAIIRILRERHGVTDSNSMPFKTLVRREYEKRHAVGKRNAVRKRNASRKKRRPR